jgi:hypothetical protein
VGINVAPIRDIAVTQPIDLRQTIDAVPASEDHHARPHLQKRERIVFVLGDEYPLHARAQLRKLHYGHRQIRQAADPMRLVEHAKADQGWFAQQTVASLELVWPGRIKNRRQRQDLIQQLGEQPLARLDALGVDAVDIELVQVNRRPGVRDEPVQNRQDALPLVTVIEQLRG